MTRVPSAAVFLAALTILASGASAQSYQADHAPTQSGLAGARIISAAVEATMPGMDGGQLYVNLDGFAIEGLDRVCVFRQDAVIPDCYDGELTLAAQDGGSVLMELWEPTDGSMSGAHGLTIFSNASAFLGDSSADHPIDVRDSVFSMLVDGQVTLPDLPRYGAVAETEDEDTGNTTTDGNSTEDGNITTDGSGDGADQDALEVPSLQDFGVLITFSPTTVLEVSGPEQALVTIEGRDQIVGFQGTPTIAPFGVQALAMPLQDGAEFQFTVSSDEAAARGIDINAVTGGFEAMLSGNPPAEPADGGTDDFGQIFQAVFNGAIIKIPTDGAEGDGPSGFELVRFQTMTATSDGQTMHYDGDAPLQVQEAGVVGAPEAYAGLPWWSWALILIALGLWITRLVLRPVQGTEVVDEDGGSRVEPPALQEYRWVGWISGPLALLILFWMWDGTVHATLGLSLMKSDLSGTAQLLMLAIQLGSMAMVLAAAALPMGSIFRSGLLLARQGKVPGPYTAAILISGVIGVGLLLMLLDTVFDVLAGQLADLAGQADGGDGEAQ